MHVDIYVLDEGNRYPIELKYKTKGINKPINGEHYNIKNQSAHDIGRYDFLFLIHSNSPLPIELIQHIKFVYLFCHLADEKIDIVLRDIETGMT